ncbi:hypothetical protein pb186bvf_005425 [Paramecium bursaria]
MLIQIVIDKGFRHPQVNTNSIQMDADPSDIVENLKILVTLKFIDLDPNDFQLYTPEGGLINLSLKIHQLPRNQKDEIVVILKRPRGTCQLC